MFDINKIKAFTFDTGGTVLDWHTGFKNGFNQLNNKLNLGINSVALANEFRKKSLGIITNQNQNELINFDLAHKLAVSEISEERNLNLTNADKHYLSFDIPSDLKVWNDFLAPFEALRNKYLCVSFTLLSNRLVFMNSKANKINWDLILSCETLEVYKPNIKAYLKTAELLQLSPEECVMVACHSFDLNAAKEAGFNTVFVKRSKEWGEDTVISIDGDYDMIISNFQELTDLMNL